MFKLISRPNKNDAIISLTSGVAWSTEDGEIKTWDINNDGVARPTDEAINAELTRLQAEFDGLGYARARELAYPITKEFIEAYTEKEIGGDTTKWDAYVVKYNKVRSDNQKP